MRVRAGALGGLPFEQMAAADQAAVDHAHDGVHRQPRLMRQERDHHHGAHQFVGRAVPVRGPSPADAPREPVEQRRHRRNRHRQPHHQAPDARARREISQPNSSSSSDATGTRLRRRLSRMRQRLMTVSGLRLCSRLGAEGTLREDPRRDLPVAANPAMLALAVAGVVERQVLEQLDVAGQADADVRAFDQVVAEQRFRRESGCPAMVAERPHVVDRLAVKDRFAEQILLRVGDGLAVGIGAAWCRRRRA